MPSYVTAVHTFVAEHADELEFQAGDKIEVLERDEAFGDGWWKGRNTKGDEGLFPATYISEDPNAVPAGMAPGDKPVNGGGATDDESPGTPLVASSGAAADANSNHLSSPFSGTDRANAEKDNRNSLLDVTGAPRSAALAAGAGAAAGAAAGAGAVSAGSGTAGSNVMDSTIGEVQDAIDTMGGSHPSPSPNNTPATKGYQLKDPQEAARELAANDADGNDDYASGDDNDAIGINSDARARLAAQAKLANEERDRQAQRESGGVADLIYSDESDEEEEGSSGSRRASRGYRGLSLNGTHPGSSTTTTIAERIEPADDDTVEAPHTQQTSAVPVSVPVQDKDVAPAQGQANDTASSPQQPQTQPWSPVPYPPVSQSQSLSAQPATGATDEAAATSAGPQEELASASGHTSHAPSAGVLAATGAAAAGAVGLGAAAFANKSVSPKDAPSSLPETSPSLSAIASMDDQALLPSPGRRTSSLPRGSPLLAATNLPMHSPVNPTAPLPAGAAPPPAHRGGIVTPQMDQKAQLQPALPISPAAGSAIPLAGAAALTSSTASSPGGLVSPGTAARMPAKPPSTWTVEEVVEWAHSRGFDETVCNKFVEQDITGDVLLELDANLLKELDIPQLGKRLRIAAAINELRRPPSAVSNRSQPQAQVQPQTSQQNSQHASPVPPPHAVLAADSRPPSQTRSPVPPHAQLTHQQTPSQSSAVSSVRGFAAAPPPSAFTSSVTPQSTPPLGSSSSPVIDDHHNAWSHGRKVSVTPTTQSIDESKAIDAPVITNGKGHSHSASLTHGRTPSVGGTASHTASRSTSSIPAPGGGSASTTLAGTSKTDLAKRESTSSLTGHKKKGSVDGKDRLSFFGRNRKAPPAAGSGNASPVGPDRSTSSRLPFGGGHSKPAVTTMTADRPDGHREGSAPSATVGAALRQIGKPDKVGYLKKKGERYNTWKSRYFVLKGSHLYYLKSESEDRVKGHIDLKGHRIIVDENTNPGNFGFRLVGPNGADKPHFFSSSNQAEVRDWMKSLMKATIARDYSVPVTSSCNIPTIPLAEAQALQPRPPSPAQREATQRATRRENVNQLTPRDASVLMSLDTTGSGRRMTSHGSSGLQPSPSRPSRDMRRPSTSKDNAMNRPSMAISDRRSVASYYQAPENEEHAELLKWVNETLPPQYPRAAHFPSSFMSGEVILLLVKHLSGIEPNPPVPSSAFAPDATGLPNVEGLLAMGETVIDAGVDSAGVSLNEIRAGDVQAITHLLETVRSWARQKGYA